FGGTESRSGGEVTHTDAKHAVWPTRSPTSGAAMAIYGGNGGQMARTVNVELVNTIDSMVVAQRKTGPNGARTARSDTSQARPRKRHEYSKRVTDRRLRANPGARRLETATDQHLRQLVQRSCTDRAPQIAS